MSAHSHIAARHQRVSALFLAACELPAQQREAFLREQCGDDDQLRREVLELITHDGEAAAVDRPVIDLAGSASGLSRDEKPPARLGRYEILAVLGEGGMGTVYRARQENPDRIVALKVIRPGIASRSMIKRFELEARLLGRLQHPGIAQIHEAGVAEGAPLHGPPQPYFAMELVDGQPLLTYAEAKRLDTPQRLELIAKICDAVHHAHQKGIVHRDLKPGNILVVDEGPADGLQPVCPQPSPHSAQPKILDFGIARVTDADIKVTTLRTDVGQLIGTLPYMSPEQIAGDPNDVDVRSDVYSLGVIAYELLSGRLPHDLDNKTMLEAARVIQSESAARLSAINRTLRGDIETLISKAIDKDKTRRYQSASDLAADIRRYLRDEPLVARPPSAVYQFRKFARRNRALVVGTAVAVVLLIAAVVGTSYGLIVARAQRDEARRAADKAEAVRQFFLDILTSPAPDVVGRDVKVVDALNRAEATLASSFPNQPEILGDVHAEMAATLERLGEHAPAEHHAREAVRIRTQTLGEGHMDTLNAMSNLASILLDFDRRQQPGAMHEAGDLLSHAEALARREHADHPEYRIDILSNQADLAFYDNRLDDAERLVRETLDLSQRYRGETAPSTIGQHQNLAVLLNVRGKPQDAEPELRQVVQLLEQTKGPRSPNTLGAKRALAAALRENKKYQQAVDIYRQNLPVVTEVLGEKHTETVVWHNELAFTLKAWGRWPQAIEAYRDAVRLARGLEKSPGADSFLLLTIEDSLGLCLDKAGQFDEAQPLFRDVLDGLMKLHGPDADTTLFEGYKLVDALLRAGDFEAARALAAERLPVAEKAVRQFGGKAPTQPQMQPGPLPCTGQTLALWRMALARSLVGLNQRQEAMALIDACVQECAALPRRDNYMLGDGLKALAECCDALEQPAQAAKLRAMIPPHTQDTPADTAPTQPSAQMP